MKRLCVVFVLALEAALGWGQTPGNWTMTETGGTSEVTLYRCRVEGNRRVLTSEKGGRTLTTTFDATGDTVRWTRSDPKGTSLELTRMGGNLEVHGETGVTRFATGPLPWVQDLNQLAGFVLGSENRFRFTAFADFLDSRLQASDMTTFVATKTKREVQRWGTGTGETWKVRVTFDDFRSAFWGAWYWFRVSDGRLVRSEEVRGGPGTPVTISELTSEEP